MDIKDNLGKRPITTAALKDLMDMSLQADEEKFPNDDEYRIKLCFGLFIHRQKIRPQSSVAPASAQPTKSASTSRQHDTELGRQIKSTEDESNICNVASNKYYGQTEATRLWYITETYPEDLILKHPLVKTFLLLKWPKLEAYYYINLVYVTIFLNIFIILRCNENSECSDNEYLIVLVTVFSTAMLIREFIQIFTFDRKYMHNIENILDLALIFFTVLSVFFEWDDEDARLSLSVIMVFLSWLQLFLVSGRHPLLSEYMQILKTVTKNFLFFLLWYSMLLLSFAACFYLLLRANNETFSNFGLTFFHVITMMVGELNSDDIKFNAVPFLSYSLFVAFIFLVTIVLFNLLNGLAISDIQEIKETASLLSIRSRVRLIKDIEHSLMNIHKRRIPLVSRIISLDRIMIFPAETSVYVYPNSNSYVVIGAPEHKLSMDRIVLSETMKIIGDKSVTLSE